MANSEQICLTSHKTLPKHTLMSSLLKHWNGHCQRGVSMSSGSGKRWSLQFTTPPEAQLFIADVSTTTTTSYAHGFAIPGSIGLEYRPLKTMQIIVAPVRQMDGGDGRTPYHLNLPPYLPPFIPLLPLLFPLVLQLMRPFRHLKTPPPSPLLPRPQLRTPLHCS